MTNEDLSCKYNVIFYDEDFIHINILKYPTNDDCLI